MVRRDGAYEGTYGLEGHGWREGHMGGRDGWTHGKEAHMYGVEGNTW